MPVLPRVVVRPSSAGRAVRLLGVLVTALGVALALAVPASAHARLVSSDPADGAVLAVAPAQVSLVFSEEIDADLVTVTLTDPGGAQVELAAPAVQGETVTQALPAVGAGAHTVAYRVVSSDGHPIQGSLAATFEAASGPSASAVPPTPAAAPGPEQVGPAPEVEPAVAAVEQGAGTPWVLLAGPVLLVLGALGFVLLRRRTRS